MSAVKRDSELAPATNRSRYATSGADLLEAGWLPERAAAAELDVSVSALRALASRRLVRSAAIGPSARLYQVGPEAHDARRALNAGHVPRGPS